MQVQPCTMFYVPIEPCAHEDICCVVNSSLQELQTRHRARRDQKRSRQGIAPALINSILYEYSHTRESILVITLHNRHFKESGINYCANTVLEIIANSCIISKCISTPAHRPARPRAPLRQTSLPGSLVVPASSASASASGRPQRPAAPQQHAAARCESLVRHDNQE